MPEMIFIFLLALVIFGPKKMPELGRQLGKALAEFKKASNDFKSQLEVEMMNIELEERAKKADVERAPAPESHNILPPEKPYETLIVPAPGAVSRDFEPVPDEPPATEAALPSVETPVNGNARAVPDA